MPSLDTIKTVGAGVVTILTGVLVIWWLIEVALVLDVAPKISNGAVALDQYQRAKDILLVVFPLFSASIAYWVGSSGTADAKKDASDAQVQLKAVLDQAPQGTLSSAKEELPQAFPEFTSTT